MRYVNVEQAIENYDKRIFYPVCRNRQSS